MYAYMYVCIILYLHALTVYTMSCVLHSHDGCCKYIDLQTCMTTQIVIVIVSLWEILHPLGPNPFCFEFLFYPLVFQADRRLFITHKSYFQFQV